jgi:hypothetical protein
MATSLLQWLLCFRDCIIEEQFWDRMSSNLDIQPQEIRYLLRGGDPFYEVWNSDFSTPEAFLSSAGSGQLHPINHVRSLLLAHAIVVLGHPVDLGRGDVKLAVGPPRHRIRPL